MASCSAYKAEGRTKRKGLSEIWHLFSPVTMRSDGALLSWGLQNICLPMGSSELIPCFILLVCMAFALPIELCLKTWVFLILLVPFSLHPTRREWAAELLTRFKPQPWVKETPALFKAVINILMIPPIFQAQHWEHELQFTSLILIIFPT